ncbi:MAG: SCO1664 family protein [Anaerolineae bacterium]|nr:SCO1664 family protein [Anaerolineae bacterium]
MTPQDDENNKTPISADRLLEVLEKGEITEEFGVMRWSSNYTFLLSVEYEDVKTMAVYKPRKGERPLWDFPDGTLCYREVAAFLTSYELGWELVPPTILRDGPHGLGSLQFFIDHDPNLNYFAFDESLQPQLRRLSLFDYIINNADRKGGHCLLDENNHLWGIDHGISFNAEHKLRTVVWDFAGETIADDLIACLEKLCAILDDTNTTYSRRIAELLSTNEINAFKSRLRRILQQKRYPKPGAGPNYPWPPV